VNDMHVCAGVSASIDRGSGDAASLRVAGWLGLAAAPTFAIMALLTGAFGGDPMDMLCSAAHGTFPLNGMALMYGLMSVFHSLPWLKWIARCRRGIHRS